MALQSVHVQRKLFTVAEYEQMISAGVLREDERLELIEGDIIEMSPIGTAHASLVAWLARLLTDQFREHALVWVQNPIRLPQSEPQPDLALLKPRADFYSERLPGPADILVLIEIADTTMEYDRNVKMPLYARSGIQEFWLIDLPQRTIEVGRDPAARGYREVHAVRPSDRLTLLAFPETSLSVATLLHLP